MLRVWFLLRFVYSFFFIVGLPLAVLVSTEVITILKDYTIKFCSSICKSRNIASASFKTYDSFKFCAGI